MAELSPVASQACWQGADQKQSQQLNRASHMAAEALDHMLISRLSFLSKGVLVFNFILICITKGGELQTHVGLQLGWRDWSEGEGECVKYFSFLPVSLEAHAPCCQSTSAPRRRQLFDVAMETPLRGRMF